MRPSTLDVKSEKDRIMRQNRQDAIKMTMMQGQQADIRQKGYEEAWTRPAKRPINVAIGTPVTQPRPPLPDNITVNPHLDPRLQRSAQNVKVEENLRDKKSDHSNGASLATPQPAVPPPVSHRPPTVPTVNRNNNDNKPSRSQLDTDHNLKRKHSNTPNPEFESKRSATEDVKPTVQSQDRHPHVKKEKDQFDGKLINIPIICISRTLHATVLHSLLYYASLILFLMAGDRAQFSPMIHCSIHHG